MTAGPFFPISEVELTVASISSWPIAAWVILLAAIVFVGEYLYLLAARHRSCHLADAAEKHLSLVAAALRNYAQENGDRLPDALAELNLRDIEGIVYRPIPRLNLDQKLMLLHDRRPTHKIIEFPALREGRGLVFSNGRMHIVTEEAFDKLLFADDALRERLGLEAITAAPGCEDERMRDAGRE